MCMRAVQKRLLMQHVAGGKSCNRDMHICNISYIDCGCTYSAYP